MTTTEKKPMTPTETALLASLVYPGVFSPGNANRKQEQALVGKGYLTRWHSISGGGLEVTDAGREVLSAIYDDAAVKAQQEKVAAVAAATAQKRRERQARLEAIAAERNAAADELARLLPPDVMSRTLTGIGRAAVAPDGSGVWGGTTYEKLTAEQVLEVVRAALEQRERETHA